MSPERTLEPLKDELRSEMGLGAHGMQPIRADELLARERQLEQREKKLFLLEEELNREAQLMEQEKTRYHTSSQGLMHLATQSKELRSQNELHEARLSERRLELFEREEELREQERQAIKEAET